jgi:predicted Zn-dependent protease
LALALALATAGCATLEEPTKNAALPPQTPTTPAVPPDAPKVTGVEKPQSNEHRQLVAMMGGEYRAPGAERYLNGILAKLAAASDLPGEAYKVTILNSPEINAFALPSGNVYVTRGLLALANDASEVAGVMAHEIAHVTARHAAQRAEQEKTSTLISNVSKTFQNAERSRQVTENRKRTLQGFTHAQEFEADRIGVQVIGRAGYDPFGASRFLQSLGRSTALRASMFGRRAAEGDISSTHPTTPERIQRAIAVARQFGAPGLGDAGRDPWLSVIDGIEFGEDPTEGVIRGRRFSHGRLAYDFTAPEGFALENTQQAVLGLGAGGAEAVRLDNVRVPASTTLETYIASGWVDGLQRASIQTKTINGLPAALATAKSDSWSFRVAVIRVGGEVFRLIFAARALNEEVDRKFTASIETFRKLTPEETARLRPQRLSVVATGAGDSVDSLAARMAVGDRARDQFLLLNGLADASAFKPGERYKIVVD